MKHNLLETKAALVSTALLALAPAVLGQTVVAPYSVRRREKAPFSTPLAWSEVKASLCPADFNIGNFTTRLKRADPWSDFFESRQSLKNAARLVSRL